MGSLLPRCFRRHLIHMHVPTYARHTPSITFWPTLQACVVFWQNMFCPDTAIIFDWALKTSHISVLSVFCARHFWNWCDIYKMAKLVHRNQPDNQFNWSHTWLAVSATVRSLLVNALLPSLFRMHATRHTHHLYLCCILLLLFVENR